MTTDAQDTRQLLVEMSLPIQTYDIDFAGIVSNIVYVRWLEDLRLKILETHYPLGRILAEGALPVLARTEIAYHSPLRLGDRPIGRIWVTGFGRSRFELRTEIVRSEQVVAEAWQKGYFIDVNTHLTVPIPPGLRRLLEVPWSADAPPTPQPGPEA